MLRKRLSVSLNVVRSGRPEQSGFTFSEKPAEISSQCSPVWKTGTIVTCRTVSPGSPQSQCSPVWKTGTIHVRAWRPRRRPASQCSPVWKTGTISRGSVVNLMTKNCLNVVRSGRPEQSVAITRGEMNMIASQCSPVWKTGTIMTLYLCSNLFSESQCSPVWKTGTMGLF